MKKQFKLEYTDNITRQVKSRIIRAKNIEDAKIWFDNHLEKNNLLDGVCEVK